MNSDNEAVLGSSRKLGGDTEHLIDGSEKRICRSTFERSNVSNLKYSLRVSLGIEHWSSVILTCS